MAVENALDGSQADPGAWEFGGGMEALEHAKEARRVGHIKAGAIIADEEDRLGLGKPAKFNEGFGLMGGEFPCVAKQVFQHDPQEALVATGLQAGGNEEFNRA